MQGGEWAFFVRQVLGKGALMYLASLVVVYAIKYRHHTWENWGGVRIIASRAPVLPGNAMYPAVDPRPNAEDYNDYGFKSRRVFRDE